ncbi:MAG: 3-phosphoshikimate 1-carboxyvinyltransferase, partial [Ruminococcaceae bacterium]|nr:3-phosphoshikimate 1-carboxyvinyltransferase [Oscillospiraceae bacterium]
MKTILSTPTPSGVIEAIPSKSHVHRLLICAALSDKPTTIRCTKTNDDIDATARCLSSLGAKIDYDGEKFRVQPISSPNDNAELDCGESGSTFRFLLPAVCALRIRAKFHLSGRLPERPLSPLYEELVSHGAVLSPMGSNPFETS